MPATRKRAPRGHDSRVGHRPGHVGHQGHRRRRCRAGGLDRGERPAARLPAGRRRRAGSRGAVDLRRRDRSTCRGRRARARRRRRAGQPGRDRAGLGSRDGPAPESGHRLAGPARRGHLPGARRRGPDDRRQDGPGARPLLLRAEDGVAARQRHSRRRRHHHRHLAGAPAVRRVRDRRVDREPLAAARPRHRHVGRGADRAVRARGRGHARRRGVRPVRRRDNGFRREANTGRWAHRRPAGRAARRELPRSRRREVHLRHRGLSAGPARRQRRAVRCRSDHVGRLDAARPDVVLRRRAGLHRGVGRAVGHRPRPRAGRRTTRRRRGHRGGLGRRALRAGTGRVGRAVVGRHGQRVVQRHDAQQRTRAAGTCAARGHRGTGRVPSPSSSQAISDSR